MLDSSASNVLYRYITLTNRRGHIAMRHSVAKMEKAIEAAKLKPAEDTRVSLGLSNRRMLMETSLHQRKTMTVYYSITIVVILGGRGSLRFGVILQMKKNGGIIAILASEPLWWALMVASCSPISRRCKCLLS